MKISKDDNLSWLDLDEINQDVGIREEKSLIDHDPDFISKECDKIDECINFNKTYYYDDSWGDELIDHLREYAMASGMNLSFFIKNKQKSTSAITKALCDNSMKKNASLDVSSSLFLDASGPLDDLQEVWRDPFNFETKLNAPELKSDWERVNKEAKMNKPSVSSQKNSVVSISGGENYNVNSSPFLASNQNSIFNPNAIGEMLADSKEDNGMRLKRHIETKKHAKVIDHELWEKSKMEYHKDGSYFVNRSVFPTESLNAHTGLNRSTINGVFSDVSYDDIPDRTMGEKIAQSNKERSDSIRREKKDYDWEAEINSKNTEISDVFFKNIEKELRK